MRRPSLLLVPFVAIALFGCDNPNVGELASGSTSAPEPQSAPKVKEPTAPGVGTPAPRTPASGYTAHEWGTFTSVQDSDGNTMVGLHHEDEPLPAFVEKRFDMTPTFGKGSASIPGPITQKLETPVIYFHTKEAMTVRVDVDFPLGILGEWFPNVSRAVPALMERADQVKDTSLGWDAVLDPSPDRTKLLDVHDDDIWAPSRNVDCAMVTSPSGGSDMFIFYRGIGAFEMPIKITHGDDGMLTVANLSSEHIPDIVLLHNDGFQGAVVHIGGVAGGQAVTVPVPKFDRGMDAYVDMARDVLQIALEADGLFADEALAMVDTWTHSYFKTPGLRALYVTPKAWTDALLPLRLDPEPVSLVRTMVGRIEVLTRESEIEASALLETLFLSRQAMDTALGRDSDHPYPGFVMEVLDEHFGRFSEPRVRRAIQQMEEGPVKAWAVQIRDLLNAKVQVGVEG